MDKSKKGKVKKVIKGLKQASKLHAGQAKVLKVHRQQLTLREQNKQREKDND